MRFLNLPLHAAVVATALFATPATAQEAPERPQYPTTEFAPGASQASISDKGVTATITMERRADIDPDVDVPVLRIVTGNVTVLEAIGVDSGTSDPDALASIVEMDPSNDTPEVYFASFSGGAHCCTNVIVAEKVQGTWVSIPIGDFDGGGDFLDDLDGDGVAEITAADNRFLYQFDCYACSAAPLAIYGVRAGAVVDVSKEPRYLAAHRDWLKNSIESALEPADWWTSRGFLAGWLAEKSRVGEGLQAWQDLNAHWDLAHDEGEEVCPDGSYPEACDEKDRKTMKFPERLRSFLTTTGYSF